jgi:hypothetical protein
MPNYFPSSPTTGQVYTYLGKSWVYNGTGWDSPRALSEIGAVQTFANATARTAAIPTPTEGIVSYLNDVDRLDVYSGSAHVPSAGLTFIRSETFSGVNAVNLNNVFSSLYRDYLIVCTGNSSNASDIQFRLRAGTDETANGYSTGSLYITDGGGPTRIYNAATNISRIGQSQIYRTMYSLFISDPFNTTTTIHNSQITAFGNNDYFGSAWGYLSTVTSYDGISLIIAAGKIAGTIKVYGYRN